MTAAGPRTAPAAETRPTGTTLRFLVMLLLTVDGVLCAVTTALLLPSYLGSIPFPISALVGGLVNLALIWAALHWTRSLRLAALPLYAWLITVAMMTFGGPGDDVIFSGHGVMNYGVILLIVLGSAPAAWLLWRRRGPASPVR